MSIVIGDLEVNAVQIRYNGKLHELQYSEKTNISSESNLFRAVEDMLKIDAGSLDGHSIDLLPETKILMIHPRSKFGV